MTQFEGKFNNTKNESLDDFYAAIGVPWIPRKMMTSSSPTIEISTSEGSWTIKTSTLMHSSSSTFKLGEEYIETMQGGRTIKSVTKIEENKMTTDSESDRGVSKKVMEFNEEGFVMILTHVSTDIVARRTFSRV